MTLQEIRDYLELGYFASGIALAVAAWVGLRQISISKADIKERKKRASLEKAMEYAHLYENKFIPLYDKFNNVCIEQGWYIDNYKELKDFTKSEIVDPETTLKRTMLMTWHPAFNLLEYIAAAFIIGVADKDAGYSIFGPSFCRAVFEGHDIIIENHKVKDFAKAMDMTIQLYKEWAPRYQQEYFPKEKVGENEMS